MKYLYFFTCVLLLLCNSCGQHQHEEKIKIIDSLLDLSYYETTRINLVESFKYAIDAMYLSEEINHSESKAWSYFSAGQALVGIGSYDRSLEYLSWAEKERYTKTAPKLLAEIHRVRGRVYVLVGFKDLSVAEFKKGLTTIEKIDNKSQINQYKSLIYENLIAHYVSTNQLDSARYYLDEDREVLKLSEEPFIYSNWSNLYGGYGQLYTKDQQFDSAAYYFDKAVEISEKYNNKYLSKIYIDRGRMEEAKKNYDQALEFYFKAIDNLKETGLKSEIPIVYTEVAKVYEIKNIPDSVTYYKSNAALLNNELAQNKVAAAENTMNFVLKKESEQNKKTTLRMAYTLGPVILLIALVTIALYGAQHKKKTKALRKKEEESELLRKRLNSSFAEVVELAKNNDSLFLTRFGEVYPEFVQNLLRRHPELTPSELCLCAMTFLNFSSKEISQYTFIEHRSVQTKKNRLRKKLQLSSGTDLYHYFKEIANS